MTPSDFHCDAVWDDREVKASIGDDFQEVMDFGGLLVFFALLIGVLFI
jgi:hypothetical protein